MKFSLITILAITGIAAASPAAELTTRALNCGGKPFKYQKCKLDSQCNSKGTGSINFTYLNVRSFNKCQALCVSNADNAGCDAVQYQIANNQCDLLIGDGFTAEAGYAYAEKETSVACGNVG